MKKLFFVLLTLTISHSLLAQERAGAENPNSSGSQLSITIEPEIMGIPTFREKNMVSSITAQIPKFTLASTAKNKITDDEEWFKKNQLSLPVFEVPNKMMGASGNVPSGIPASYNGHILVKAIVSGAYNFFIYGKDYSDGRYLLITDSSNSKTLHFLDFGSYSMSPQYVEADRDFIHQALTWAQVKDDVLYISHSHNTYAASSKGMNAYITAISLKDYRVMWRSAPLVSNAANFEIYKDALICGYGFTSEPDFLFTLNRYTGSVVQKLPLSSGPSYIIRKGSQLFVRTYSSDYIFKIQ
jgi:hypothetical protein